jgi:hypothetical protein
MFKKKKFLIAMWCVQVPTDGLVLKGWYNTITVAIYGSVTSAKPAKTSPPPPPPPPRKVQGQ